MNLHVDNEVGLLKTVILGIANDFGGSFKNIKSGDFNV